MIRARLIFLLLTSLMSAPLSAQAAFMCHVLFTHPMIQDLAKLRITIDQAQARGDSSLSTASLRHSYAKKEKEVLQYFEQDQKMSREEILSQLKSEIVKIQSGNSTEAERQKKMVEEQKRQINERLTQVGKKINFHEIAPGEFMMGEKLDRAVEITRPYKMAATVTTQFVWTKIAKEIRLRFKDDYKSLNEDSFPIEGETLPSVSQSYNHIMLWIEGLNRLARAENPVVAELFPDFQKGEIFRLPTEAEWEFVARARGHVEGKTFFDEDHSTDYAWSVENSNSKIHPVGEKKPLIFEQKEFFDIYGNVCQFVADANLHSHDTPPKGKDPFQKGTPFSARFLRGVGARGSYFIFDAGNRQMSLSPTQAYDLAGFRLARSRP